LFTNVVEKEFSEVELPIYGVLRSSPCPAGEAKQDTLVINTAFE
jgi:hypothetical protein